MIKRILLLQIVVFLAVGEAVMRFDQHTLFFKGARATVLEEKPRGGKEIELVDSGKFDPRPSTLRVMVIGDSFLYGGIEDSDYIFSNQLRQRLRERNCDGFDGADVLDLSTPGANTYRNYQNFQAYVDRFAPNVVVWVYSRNDVYGTLGEETPDQEGVRARKRTDLAVGDRINNLLRESQRAVLGNISVLKWIFKTVNTELKLQGILVPGTQHHHLIHRSHSPGFPGWIRSQEYLEDVIQTCREKGIFLIVFDSPYLHMLKSYGIYEEQDEMIRHWFESRGAHFVNGVDPFLEDSGGDYAISRLDMHPNEAAHGVITDLLYEYILDHYPPG